MNPEPQGNKWRVRFRDADGQRRNRTFSTEAEAEEFCQEQMALRRPQRFARKTLAEFEAASWPARSRNLKPSTKSQYRSVLDLHLLPELGRLDLSKIDRNRVLRFIAAMEKKGLSPARTDTCITQGTMLMEEAVRAGVVGINPFRQIAKSARPRVERREGRFLTREEIGRLRAAMVPEYRALISIMAFCGLRIGEVQALMPDALDLDGPPGTRTVTVKRAAEGKAVDWHIGTPKSKASIRTVPVPNHVADQLRTHLATYVAEKPGWKESGFVFPAMEGGKLKAFKFREKYFHPAAKKAGLVGPGRKLVPHDLRHTAVSLWVKNEATPIEVAAYAGHADVRTVFDTYAHLWGKTERERMAAAMDQFVPALTASELEDLRSAMPS